MTPLTLVAFFAWSRCLGYARARAFGWSRLERLARACLTPFLPWWRALSLIAYLARARPARLPTAVVGFPVILLAQYGAAAGEAVGLLLGKGNAEILFSQTHLRGLRWKAEVPLGGLSPSEQ